MKSIGNISLVWRTGKGGRRHIVGIIKSNVTEAVRFEYIKENIAAAKRDGFSPYVDFPDIEIIYTNDVLDIFGQRLVKSERSDIQKYYDFWEVDKNFVDDKYYMLAHTQGLLSTDNFEFLAEFYPRSEMRFVSEICGLTHTQILRDTVKIGDVLQWEKEKENIFDTNAIKVLKEGIFIGYIKKIHNKVFSSNSTQAFQINVKSVDQNGFINRIFIRISI